MITEQQTFGMNTYNCQLHIITAVYSCMAHPVHTPSFCSNVECLHRKSQVSFRCHVLPLQFAPLLPSATCQSPDAESEWGLSPKLPLLFHRREALCFFAIKRSVQVSKECASGHSKNNSIFSHLTMDDGTSDISGRKATGLAFRNLNKPINISFCGSSYAKNVSHPPLAT